MILGKYTKSYVFNYLSIFLIILGMYFVAYSFDIKVAMVCYSLVGFCTLLNKMMNKFAKSGTDEIFRIEFTVFTEVISFKFFPIFLGIILDFTKWYHIISYTLFAITGIERLCIYTTDEIKKTSKKTSKYITGLPIYSLAVTIPLIYLISKILIQFDNSINIFETLFTLLIYLSSILFVLNVKFLKLNNKMYSILSILFIVGFILICIF